MRKIAKFIIASALALMATTARAAVVVGPVSTLFIKDEGVTIATNPVTLDFIGSAVTAVKVGVSSVTITVTGGSSGVSVYPATSTIIAPLGVAASTITLDAGSVSQLALSFSTNSGTGFYRSQTWNFNDNAFTIVADGYEGLTVARDPTFAIATVGIGTRYPGGRLHIKSSSSGEPALILQSGSSNGADLRFMDSSGVTESYYGIERYNGVSNNSDLFIFGNGNNYLRFGIELNVNDEFTERVHVGHHGNNSHTGHAGLNVYGNVAIGTVTATNAATPYHGLMVQGESIFLSSMTLSSGVKVSTTIPTTGQVLKYDGSKWSPGTDSSGGGGGGTTIWVKEDGSAVDNAVSTMNFTNGLNVTSSPSGQVNVAVDYSTVTAQGNTFNAASKLLQLDGSGLVPTANLPTTVAYTNVANTFSSSQTINSSLGVSSTTIITATGTTSALKIVANGTYGTTDGTSGGLLVDCTGGGGLSGECVQFYTNASTQAALGGIVNIIQALAQNTWNEPALYIKMNSTNGGAANARFDGPVPQIEFVETDQVSPAGKYEIGVNGDVFYVAGRNAPSSAFDTFVQFVRKDASGGGYVMLTSTQTPLRFGDADGSNYASFRATDTMTYNTKYVLPLTTGTVDQVLAIQAVNGTETFLYWKTDTSGGGGGGYALEPATITARFDAGATASTFTVTSTFTISGATFSINGQAYKLVAGGSSGQFLRTDGAVGLQTLTWTTPAGSGDAVLASTQSWSGSNTWVNVATADFSGATNMLMPKSTDVSGKIAMGSISIDSDDGRVFIGTGTAQKPVISGIAFQTFTTTGTYTPNPRMAFCKVWVTGTGGSAATCTATDCESGGGGAAGTAIGIFSAATIGASQAVSIPAAPTSGTAGATTSFGSLMTSPSGGQGSNSGATTTVGANGIGGLGSTPTGGDVQIKGGDATSGICYSTNFGQGGNGGASLWGGGGWGFTGASATGGVGNDGKAYGSGAGGCYAPDATDRNSGTGGGGLVIVQEFLN